MFRKWYNRDIFAFSFMFASAFFGSIQAKASPVPKKGKLGLAGTLGSSCSSNDSSQICLALKYVVYKDAYGQESVSAAEAINNIEGINNVWQQCNIKFQIDRFDSISPDTYGLSYDPANDSELPSIRSQFEDDSTLLVVTTGAWNRNGSLGYTGANAWTSLPGDSPFGVVLEQSVGTFSNIIAHEIGHYLNLLHIGDSSNLMNAIIYPESSVLGSDQCELARSTALSSWQKMLR